MGFIGTFVFTVLAQATEEAAADPAALAQLWDLVKRGGWLMLPIGLCSVLALGLFIERMLATRRESVSPSSLQLNVESLLARGLIADALEICRGTPSALGRVLAAGIRLFAADTKAAITREEVKDALEASGRRESGELRRFVGGIATIATVAPLLGLLGTVWGMVKTFQTIETAPIVSKTVMAGGIWTALITTVAGLIVAIPTVIAHRIVTARVTERVTELEAGAERTAELLMRPESGAPSEQETASESASPPEPPAAAAEAQ